MLTQTPLSVVLPCMLLLFAWPSEPPPPAPAPSSPVAHDPDMDQRYRVFKWVVGNDPIKLIRVRDGFCFLSAVGGSFAGGGEHVRVYVEGGWWYLDGNCLQPLVWAEATCVEFDRLAGDVSRRCNVVARTPKARPSDSDR